MLEWSALVFAIEKIIFTFQVNAETEKTISAEMTLFSEFGLKELDVVYVLYHKIHRRS